MAGNSTESGRSVTSKITSILMTFTRGSVHSLTEIARLAGLPVSTSTGSPPSSRRGACWSARSAVTTGWGCPCA